MNSEEKRYIATRFDGWYWHYHIIKDRDLKEWMKDGSFDDDIGSKETLQWKFYELGRDVTKQELIDLANAKT